MRKASVPRRSEMNWLKDASSMVPVLVAAISAQSCTTCVTLLAEPALVARMPSTTTESPRKSTANSTFVGLRPNTLILETASCASPGSGGARSGADIMWADEARDIVAEHVPGGTR